MYYTIEKSTNRQGLSYLYKTACIYNKKRQPLGRLDELQKLYPDPIAPEFDSFK